LVWFSCSYFGSELLQLPEKKTLCQLKIVPIHRRRKEKICVTRASKVSALLITRDERNTCSTGFLTAIFALLMTAANCSKNAVFALGNHCSFR